MTALKTTFAVLAAAGLAAAQPVAAAQARTASPVADSEELAGTGAALPAILAILAVAIISILSASSDNDEDLPTSP